MFRNKDFDPNFQYSPRGNLYETLNIPEDFLDRIAIVYKLKFEN